MRNIAFGETLFLGIDPPTERYLVFWAADHLHAIFPPTWRLDHVVIAPVTPVVDTRVLQRKRPDLSFVLIDSTGAQNKFVVEIRSKLEPRDVDRLSHDLQTYRAGDTNLMVVAPFLSAQSRGLLIDSGINYLDMTGNVRVQIDHPALYIERQGARKNPWTQARGQQSLSGPAAGRVVRALCDYRPPYSMRTLATNAETLPGTVSKIVALLDREALIQREARGKYAGAVVAVKWRDLIRRWTQDYTFEASNSVAAYLEPRGLDALFRKLKDPALPIGRYGITGAFASAYYAPIVQPRLLALYVANRDEAAQVLGLRRAERGANLLLAEPFDPVVFSRTVVRDDLTYAAFSQVAADLLTGPGRGPQEGSALLQWMEEHEDAWRR